MFDKAMFKNEQVFRSAFVVPWHPKLIDVYLWLAEMDIETIFTCLYEKRDYPGVHNSNPLRGFDLRSRAIDSPDIIEDMTNDHWQYDPKRPGLKVCLLHNVGRGMHFHFQVHPRTILLF